MNMLHNQDINGAVYTIAYRLIFRYTQLSVINITQLWV
jgi:hypothetical protein